MKEKISRFFLNSGFRVAREGVLSRGYPFGRMPVPAFEKMLESRFPYVRRNPLVAWGESFSGEDAQAGKQYFMQVRDFAEHKWVNVTYVPKNQEIRIGG